MTASSASHCKQVGPWYLAQRTRASRPEQTMERSKSTSQSYKLPPPHDTHSSSQPRRPDAASTYIVQSHHNHPISTTSTQAGDIRYIKLTIIHPNPNHPTYPAMTSALRLGACFLSHPRHIVSFPRYTSSFPSKACFPFPFQAHLPLSYPKHNSPLLFKAQPPSIFSFPCSLTHYT